MESFILLDYLPKCNSFVPEQAQCKFPSTRSAAWRIINAEFEAYLKKHNWHNASIMNGIWILSSAFITKLIQPFCTTKNLCRVFIILHISCYIRGCIIAINLIRRSIVCYIFWSWLRMDLPDVYNFCLLLSLFRNKLNIYKSYVKFQFTFYSKYDWNQFLEISLDKKENCIIITFCCFYIHNIIHCSTKKKVH